MKETQLLKDGSVDAKSVIQYLRSQNVGQGMEINIKQVETGAWAWMADTGNSFSLLGIGFAGVEDGPWDVLFVTYAYPRLYRISIGG